MDDMEAKVRGLQSRTGNDNLYRTQSLAACGSAPLLLVTNCAICLCIADHSFSRWSGHFFSGLHHLYATPLQVLFIYATPLHAPLVCKTTAGAIYMRHHWHCRCHLYATPLHAPLVCNTTAGAIYMRHHCRCHLYATPLTLHMRPRDTTGSEGAICVRHYCRCHLYVTPLQAPLVCNTTAGTT